MFNKKDYMSSLNKARRKRMDEHLKEHNPAAYDAIIRLREKEHTKEK